MSLLFQFLAFLLAGFVASQLTPVGLKKIINVDEHLPTFTGLFGNKFATFALSVVGFVEAFMPVFLMAGIALFDMAWIVAAATPILFVMFGAAVVHAVIWKNSQKDPVSIFFATAVTLVFAGLM